MLLQGDSVGRSVTLLVLQHLSLPVSLLCILQAYYIQIWLSCVLAVMDPKLKHLLYPKASPGSVGLSLAAGSCRLLERSNLLSCCFPLLTICEYLLQIPSSSSSLLRLLHFLSLDIFTIHIHGIKCSSCSHSAPWDPSAVMVCSHYAALHLLCPSLGFCTFPCLSVRERFEIHSSQWRKHYHGAPGSEILGNESQEHLFSAGNCPGTRQKKSWAR